MCIKPSLALFFSLADQRDFTKVTCATPTTAIPQWRLCHWRLKAEIICCCWLPCCWTSLLSGRCFCFSQATDSLMAPFLLPPGTSDHLLLSGEAEETTYTITTLFFRVLPSWHTWVTEQSRCPTKLCGSKTTYECITLSLKETHHVVPHGFQIHTGISMNREKNCLRNFWMVWVFFCKTLMLCLKR